jgi:hypothetical protein
MIRKEISNIEQGLTNDEILRLPKPLPLCPLNPSVTMGKIRLLAETAGALFYCQFNF